MNKKRFKLSLEKKFKPHERILQILFCVAFILTGIGVGSFFLASILLPNGVSFGESSPHDPIGGMFLSILILILFYPPIQLPFTALLVMGGVASLILQNITSDEAEILLYTFTGVPILIAAALMLLILPFTLLVFFA